jgi:SAM-dependent methyltransferase
MAVRARHGIGRRRGCRDGRERGGRVVRIADATAFERAMSSAAEQAGADQSSFYDGRYAAGYMQDFSDPYEACRVVTIRDTLDRLGDEPRRVLDYGCGEGRYLDVVGERFPHADLVGCDVSTVALEHARTLRPRAEYVELRDGRAPLPDGSFDLIVCVEVLEHVADVELTTRELGRLLRPGGRLVLTTPCANAGSFEWVLNRLRGGLEQTPDGYGRFATDEPGHLRRLTSRDLRVLLQRAGLRVDRVDFRGQLFAALMIRWPGRLARVFGPRAVTELGLLDWHLFRRLPNGSTMLAVARRPPA